MRHCLTKQALEALTRLQTAALALSLRKMLWR